MSKETFGVCVLRKYNEGAVSGIEQHVERRATISHTNPDIQRSKSKNNYDLAKHFDETFKRQIKNRLKNVIVPKKDKRNIVMAELLFSASPVFFEKKSDAEIRQYFTDCYNFVAKKYGEENIISAMVHLDEKTPHMHLCFVPVTKENKLCAKELFNHKMDELQEEVHNCVFQKYGFKRGQHKKKHLETLDWKIQQYTQKKEELEKQIAELGAIRDNNQYYKLNRDLKKTQAMLSKMFDVIESNPELMKHYKMVAEELEKRKSEKEIE